jgi:hypothetical protein
MQLIQIIDLIVLINLNFNNIIRRFIYILYLILGYLINLVSLRLFIGFNSIFDHHIYDPFVYLDDYGNLSKILILRMLYVIHLFLYDPINAKLILFYFVVVTLLMFGLFIGNLLILFYFDRKCQIFE